MPKWSARDTVLVVVIVAFAVLVGFYPVILLVGWPLIPLIAAVVWARRVSGVLGEIRNELQQLRRHLERSDD
jgi:hypothetical protein